MDENTNVNTPTVTAPFIAPSSAAVAPPPAAAVTPEHISGIHRHLDQIGSLVKEGFENVVDFLKKEAPVVGAGAAAVASVVPGAAAVAGVVEKVVDVVEGVVRCVCDCSASHSPTGCSSPGCPCKAPNTLARAASSP